MLETYKIITNKAMFTKVTFLNSALCQLGDIQIKKNEVNETCKNPKLFTDCKYPLREQGTVNEFKAKLEEHWKEEQYITPFD